MTLSEAFERGGYAGIVRNFTRFMVDKLVENNSKSGWQFCGVSYLLNRCSQELWELRRAVKIGKRPPEEIKREAADIANFAMMIADVYEREYSEPSPSLSESRTESKPVS